MEDTIVMLLLLVIAAVLAPLAVRAFKLLGVQIDETALRQSLHQNELLREVVKAGVQYAEEQGAKYFKERGKMASHVKLNHATRFVSQRFPDAPLDELEQLVEAALPAAGAGAAGKQ
jgi:hypothetical protein